MKTTRPISATATITGLVGLVAGGLAIVALRGWNEAPYIKTLTVMALVALPMIAVDAGLFHTWRNPSTGLAPGPVNAFHLERFLRKLVGFWLTIGALAFVYWLLPEYSRDFFQPFFGAARFALSILVVASPLYIAFVDRRQIEPNDAYAELGALAGGTLPADWSKLLAHAKAWTIKGFFLPLMFVFLNNFLVDLWATPAPFAFAKFSDLYDRFYQIFFMIDVMFAVVGYVMTLRLLDTQIRSSEPTVFGWVICLVCYEPFYNQIGNSYLNYESDNFFWGDLLGPFPAAYAIWGSVILILLLTYAWATMAFGLRFSNLTNRGIITHGPYALMKHPAYVSKNISWWLISIPFLSQASWPDTFRQTILLGLVSTIYLCRAITEERHLSREPAYREYQAWIRENGLWARVLRLARGRRLGEPSSAAPQVRS